MPGASLAWVRVVVHHLSLWCAGLNFKGEFFLPDRLGPGPLSSSLGPEAAAVALDNALDHDQAAGIPRPGTNISISSEVRVIRWGALKRSGDR